MGMKTRTKLEGLKVGDKVVRTDLNPMWIEFLKRHGLEPDAVLTVSSNEQPNSFFGLEGLGEAWIAENFKKVN